MEAAKVGTNLYTGLCGVRMNHRQRLSRKLSVSMKKILVLRLMYSSRDVPDRERDWSRL